jgi:hypothetical protein
MRDPKKKRTECQIFFFDSYEVCGIGCKRFSDSKNVNRD